MPHSNLIACLIALYLGTYVLEAYGVAPAPAPPAGTGVPLPSTPATVCTRQTLYKATSSNAGCRATLYNNRAADLSCCQVLRDYYGPNSTLPSRNCFCVEDYWTSFSALNNVSGVNFSKYITTCSAKGYPIYYWQSTGGSCNPKARAPAATPAPTAKASATAPAPASKTPKAPTTAPAPKAPAPAPQTSSTPVRRPRQRSFGAWLQGLKDDGLTCLAFTIMLTSAMGVVLMTWPFVYDMGMTIARQKVACQKVACTP